MAQIFLRNIPRIVHEHSCEIFHEYSCGVSHEYSSQKYPEKYRQISFSKTSKSFSKSYFNIHILCLIFKIIFHCFTKIFLKHSEKRFIESFNNKSRVNDKITKQKTILKIGFKILKTYFSSMRKIQIAKNSF